jgi:hypothetical protein
VNKRYQTTTRVMLIGNMMMRQLMQQDKLMHGLGGFWVGARAHALQNTATHWADIAQLCSVTL